VYKCKSLSARFSNAIAGASVAALLGLPGAATATTLGFQAIDLPDAGGGDLWRYEYRLTGPLAAFSSVNLYFSPSMYADLTWVANDSPAQIDLLPIIQPDLPLGADGIASIVALTSLPGSFSSGSALTFLWTGRGTPGAQAYEVLDDTFNVISAGQTFDVGVPQVPEPESVLLTSLGLGLLVWRRRR